MSFELVPFVLFSLVQLLTICHRGFFERLSDNVAFESQFFISYVLITGGMSTFYFMSQLHNVAEYWFIHGFITEEAISQRKLDQMNGRVKVFHKQELVPLFLFIFIIGALYGAIAPVASVFVILFFRSAYKVFKYMALFIYGKTYENGGQLFYSLSTILFFILYLAVLIIVGYLSLYGTSAMSGLFAVMLLIILVTQIHVQRTFVVPSRTLSLAKARIIDDAKGAYQQKHDNVGNYLSANSGQDREKGRHRRSSSLLQSLLDNAADDIDEDTAEISMDSNDTLGSESRRALADRRMQERYREQDSLSDVTDDDARAIDFFIYRQPSLNRVTWEISPRPYRKGLDRDVHGEIWR